MSQKKKPVNLTDDEIHLITVTLRLAGARPKKSMTKEQRKLRPQHRKNMDKLLDKILKHDSSAKSDT